MKKHKTTLKILPIVIRRSVALFTIKVILLELIFEIVYLTWRTVIHYLPFSLETIVTLNGVSIIFFLILITVIQNILLVYIALRWVNDYYEISPDEISHVTGIFSKTRKSYPYRDIQSITVHQGVMGRLFNYGEVNLYIPTLGHELHFREVSDPARFVELVKSTNPNLETGKYIFQR
jgi:uncharacterized membrane protein YdbT with pleckstrin-like domain